MTAAEGDKSVKGSARGRQFVLLAVLLCLVPVVAGCASRPPRQEASTQSLVGLWSNATAKGQPASLSEIGFGEDGSFRHSGNNALGLPVNFGGRYQVGNSAEGSVVRLTYDDFPDKPTEWFFRLDGDTLTVAPGVNDLETGVATVFSRAQEQ